MRKRPWEVVLLTVLYAAAPLFNLSLTLLVRGYSLLDMPSLVMALDPWDLAGLAADWVLAWAVWSVSRTGWWVFLVLNVFLVVLSIAKAAALPEGYLFLVVGGNVLNMAVASLLFTRHARSPYFSPRLRWWDTKDRYRVSQVLDVPLTIRQGEKEGRGLVLDVSVTGCYAEVPEGFDANTEVQVEFSCWGLVLGSRGRIMRYFKPGDSLQGYGIQFVKKDSDHKRIFRALIHILKAHQVPLRN